MLVIVFVVVVWKVERLRNIFMPVSSYTKSASHRHSKMEEALRKEAETDKDMKGREKARMLAASTPSATGVSSEQPRATMEGGSAPSDQNKRWTLIAKPTDVRNTMEADV